MGVSYVAVCRVPPSWRIKAGRYTNPSGDLEGEGGNGVSWYAERNPRQLANFVLIKMYGPLQKQDGHGGAVASFKGEATIETLDDTTTAPLTWRNIRLIPASRCP